MELLFSSTQGKGAQQEETGNDAYGLQTKDLSLCYHQNTRIMRWSICFKVLVEARSGTIAFFFLLIHGPVMVPIFKDLITLKGPDMTNTCPLSVPDRKSVV